MKKEELIKEAWGGTNENINENGWYYFGYCVNGWDDVKDWLKENNLISDKSYYNMTYDELDNGDLFNVKIRPKSLQGIENNNGWIKIESEEDLPKENSIFWTLRHGSTVPLYKEVFNDLDVNYWLKTYTHYQPIEKPKPPIY